MGCLDLEGRALMSGILDLALVWQGHWKDSQSMNLEALSTTVSVSRWSCTYNLPNCEKGVSVVHTSKLPFLVFCYCSLNRLIITILVTKSWKLTVMQHHWLNSELQIVFRIFFFICFFHWCTRNMIKCRRTYSLCMELCKIDIGALFA